MVANTIKLNGHPHRLAALAGAVPTPEVRHVNGAAEVDWGDWVKIDAANFPMRISAKHQSNPLLVVECWVKLVKDADGNPLKLRSNAVNLRLRDECCDESLSTV